MGANAQTSVPTFTSGQVLTAAQQNESARTGVPVFATTGTRDAAFGGTGEKTLAEGQLAYVEGTGLQSYNGSTWVTWGTAPASSGLALVQAQTAFSAVSSVSFNNVFTSTYTNYKIFVRYTTSTTNNVAFRLRASSTDATGTNYNYTLLQATGSGASGSISNNDTSVLVAQYTNGGTNFAGVELTVMGPQLAELTNIGAFGLSNVNGNNNPNQYWYNGNHTLTTAYDGGTLFVASGTMTGSYTIYGLAKS